MSPPTFSDLLKSAGDVLLDDYTSKYLLKAKSTPSNLPVALTIEDEIKEGKRVEGTLTLKYKEPNTGISFDKIKLKGNSLNYEASKVVEGVKIKVKGDGTVDGTSASTEKKGPRYAVTAGGDKKKVTGSVTYALLKRCFVGCDATYAFSGGSPAYNAGVSYGFKSVFGGVIYSHKNIFNFALMWTPDPKLALAATIDSVKKEPTFGLKYGVSNTVAVGAKSTKESISLVYVNKIDKAATLVLAATSKYNDIQAKPTFGASITIG